MTEPKLKSSPKLRTPGAKKKLGLSVPPALRLPHEDLITKEQEREIEQSDASMTSQTSQTSPTSHTRETNPSVEQLPVSPTRDFTKVANSIGREAVPAGLFSGKSKQLYDCLYSLTRGAITPTRTVRISRPKLMAKANIGSRVTFDANIERLISVGLINVKHIVGEHDGNEYTVHLPEEVLTSMTSLTSQTSMSSLTGSAQKLDRLVRLETSLTRHTSSLEESTTYNGSKTFIKTNTDDDEAFASFVKTFRDVTVEITGKNPTAADSARWQELAEVLIAELKIAAARTTISSVPAFLAEHLRRRLWKLDKKQAQAEGRELPDQVLKSTISDDAATCPDCHGSGWWYPEGQDRGVAKCKHSNMSKIDPQIG